MEYFSDPTLNKVYLEAGKVAFQAATGPAKNLVTSVLSSLKGYEAYLRETHRKVSVFRSLVNPNQSISTAEHYVPAHFCPAAKNDVEIEQEDLIASLRLPQRYVISGYAGYGKSMAMRYIALSLFENPIGKIPLFIELRALNRLGSPNLLAFINSTYAQGSAVSQKSFERGLESGLFVILLDGFDEVGHEIRQTVESQILALSVDYPLNGLVISGRPNENRYSSWRDFNLLKLKPMSKLQTVNLIEKLDYDAGLKKRFIQKLNKGLFESHESFLSTPLLAILMLLTFQKNANIPDKMYLFYGKAYETLFNQHDAMKEQYERPRKSGLQIDEFQNLFATFCFITYVKEKIEFTQVEISAFARESIKYNDLGADVEDVLYDLQESVCLMVNEGNSYFFIHRSFQEYFTAVFLSNCPETDRDKFLDNVAPRHWDQVLSMLYDMSADQIEATWLHKRMSDYFKKVGSAAGQVMPHYALYDRVYVHRKNEMISMWHLGWGDYGRLVSTVRRFLPEAARPARFDGSALNAYLTENWDVIPSQSEERVSGRTGDALEREFLLIDIPAEILESCGLVSSAKEEHEHLRKAWRAIERRRISRGSLIDSVLDS